MLTALRFAEQPLNKCFLVTISNLQIKPGGKKRSALLQLKIVDTDDVDQVDFVETRSNMW